jgi:hypothetical protein
LSTRENLPRSYIWGRPKIQLSRDIHRVATPRWISRIRIYLFPHRNALKQLPRKANLNRCSMKEVSELCSRGGGPRCSREEAPCRTQLSSYNVRMAMEWAHTPIHIRFGNCSRPVIKSATLLDLPMHKKEGTRQGVHEPLRTLIMTSKNTHTHTQYTRRIAMITIPFKRHILCAQRL